ncbi:MAG: pantetheine-phosphate adenylyltransferase [Solobacterium sp.]|nr:pantetheine-phosphate adenylyltransferase [Solobacterium sp.]
MIACYPGTFDPITKGHLDIILRAAKMFDEVVVLIMKNPRKKATFTEEERAKMIATVIEKQNCANVRVEVGSGLTVDYVKKLGGKAIVRGIRAVSDYEYELQQATANQTLDPNIETVFLIAKPEYSFLSSSIVKEVALGGGDITPFLPAEIIKDVQEELTKG